MGNTINIKRRSVWDILSIRSHDDFHNYLLCEAIDRYKKNREKDGEGMGSVLAICANVREAISFKHYGFDEILLTGLTEPSRELIEEMKDEPRIKYEKQNSECLSLASKSFDLVVCKEGIHHLARPVLGVYEMLRVTRSSIIIIEPAETIIGRLLEKLNLSSVYEKNQIGNIDLRDNYVYRWNVTKFKDLLNSYYLESGYKLDVTLGWMSSKFNAHPSKIIRILAAITGFLSSYLPGSKGNYLSAMIVIGNDLPQEILPINDINK